MWPTSLQVALLPVPNAQVIAVADPLLYSVTASVGDVAPVAAFTKSVLAAHAIGIGTPSAPVEPLQLWLLRRTTETCYLPHWRLCKYIAQPAGNQPVAAAANGTPLDAVQVIALLP